MSNFMCHCSSKLYTVQEAEFPSAKAECELRNFCGAASCSTPHVYKVNCVVPPVGHRPQKWGVRHTPHTPGGAAHG